MPIVDARLSLGRSNRLFAAIKHVNPVLAGLIKDNPAVFRRLLGRLCMRVTHELK